ncbi:MAG: hypothetical protein WAT93_12865 [Pontixanthobacter sp.]
MRLKSTAFAILALGASSIANAATPAENLDCAVWTSVMMDQSDDPDATSGLGFTLSWFIGLYEGATGQEIDDAIFVRASNMTSEELDALGPGCLDRMSVFGDRLASLADRLESEGN